MTTEQEQTIRDRLAKATPGSWTHEPHGDTVALYAGRTSGFLTAQHGLRLMNLADGYRNFPANADLIAHAPEDLALLLAAFDAARADTEAQVAETAAQANIAVCYDREREVAEIKLAALLSRLEALEQRYRAQAATAEQDGEERVRMVCDDVADDLAALRKEMGQ